MSTFELERPDLRAPSERAPAVTGGAASAPDPELEILAGLLGAAAQGDHDAFTDFYRRTSARVYGLVRRILVDPGLSEEVTQEVFFGVWQDSRKFDPSLGSPLGWLMTIAHRRAVDRVRSHQSGTSRDQRWAVASHLAADQDEVADIVARRLDARELMASLAGLSPLQRESISLAYFGSLTYREVAERLEAPVPTVKSRIREGLRQLRLQLETT
ncbi:ECF RNA polymerase sigma factor SigK [Arthrobacter sp. SO5]|uniref:ECF RNA polymerase sigma factor SigK n=1 Tax=Arthrobacter sp. SO5 TaxID=1897055 RepID=UPI001E334195|nr:ECF RNA polymerase sigma factor SigK [Arthrobacter sp. SO5]MCB5272660.1 ECF RNA polymerase sigma factor SigK [Arthrobacter sp. SO5]